MSIDPSRWLDKYGDLLYRMAFVRVRDTVASEDIVQETLLAALKSRSSFRGDSSEQTWLVGILKHKIVDHLRARFRQEQAGDEDILSPIDQRGFESSGDWAGHWSPGFRPVDWGFGPEELLTKAEFWDAFNHCLTLLPRRTASLFALHVMDDISSEQLCHDFELTATNLRVMLYRARKQLRECLEVRWIKKEAKK